MSSIRRSAGRRLSAAAVIVATFASVLAVALGAAPASAAPGVSSVSPSGGVVAGDTQVTVTGTGFVAGSKVELVEIDPFDSSVETVIAGTGGTVSADGTRISGVTLPTTGQAPSNNAGALMAASDVSYFVRVTNPDDTSSTAGGEFNLLGETPTIQAITPATVIRGRATRITLTGANFARRASVTINNPGFPAAGATFSTPTWVALDEFRITVTVPSDYPLGARNITFTNTDGKTVTCTGCLNVGAPSPVLVPSVTGVSPNQASNGDANSAFSITIEGENFAPNAADLEAALVGDCNGETGCGLDGHVIPLTITGTTQDGGGIGGSTDTITGTVDLVLESPGRYDVRVSNVGAAPGVGARDKGFEILAGAPTISTPSAGSPVTIDPEDLQTYTVKGSNFAIGDRITIPGVDITQVVVKDRTTIEFRGVPTGEGIGGLTTLTVTHTNGNTATCTNCVNVILPRTATETYIDAVYRLFVERPATTANLDRWRADVDAGRRNELTQQLVKTDEYAGVRVDALYRLILQRGADAKGRTYWVGEVGNGTRLDQIATFFFGGDEYFSRQGKTNGGFVDGLYRDILHRAADAKGRAFWVGQLDSGALDRPGVAAEFYASIESRNDRVTTLYQEILNRNPDSKGKAYWAGEIRDLGDLVLASFLASSDEYYRRVTGVAP